MENTNFNGIDIYVVFYIRHGDPIYDPNSLTPLGERQAEALAKRLALYGIDKIYTSPSTRAVQTAKPTCDLLKKQAEIVDFADEKHAWEEFTLEKPGGKSWIFQDTKMKMLFADESVISLGHKWYEHDELKPYKKGVERVSDEAFGFFRMLGYEHIKNTGKYKVVEPNDERVALFAHHGFGIAFLSEILGIPYPVFANHFDICHTGMTVINFKEENGYAFPRILTFSSDSHLYREGLPTKYNNQIYL